LFIGSAQCAGFEHDEGLFFTVAKEAMNGKILYRDIVDNKPPGLYFSLMPAVLACGNNVFCIRSIAAILNLVSAALLYLACRKHLSGLASLAPPVLYLLYSFAATNVFFRSEFVLGHLFALAFFLFSCAFDGRKTAFLLAAMPIAFGAWVKPAFPLLFVPAYLLLMHKKIISRKEALDSLLVFIAASAALAIAFAPFSDYSALISDSGGWFGSILAHLSATGIASFASYLFFFILLFGLVSLAAALDYGKSSAFEQLCAVVFASYFIFAIVFKLFSLTYHFLLIPLFFPAFSLLAGSALSASLRGASAWQESAARAFPIILGICVSLAVVHGIIPTALDYYFSTSHACPPCSLAMDSIRAMANGSLYVYPSRAGYYFALNASPFTPAIYHHEIFSSEIETTEWFQKEVVSPLVSRQPNVVLLFDDETSLINASAAHQRYLYLAQTLSANYSLYPAPGCNGAQAYVKNGIMPAPAAK